MLPTPPQQPAGLPGYSTPQHHFPVPRGMHVFPAQQAFAAPPHGQNLMSLQRAQPSQHPMQMFEVMPAVILALMGLITSTKGSRARIPSTPAAPMKFCRISLTLTWQLLKTTSRHRYRRSISSTTVSWRCSTILQCPCQAATI